MVAPKGGRTVRRTEWLQETRNMRFEEAYAGWQAGRLRREEAARLLGVCERSFRRYIDRYEEDGLQGLIDHRVGQISQRRAPVDEVMALTSCYRARHEGWSAKHYYAWYRRAGGRRSYTWVKRELQAARCARASGYALRPWHSTQAKADNLRATVDIIILDRK